MQKTQKFQLISSILLLIIFFRFYYLQIYQHQKYEYQAGVNSIRKVVLNAPRGIIYDRIGAPLVDNRQIYDLALVPFDVTEAFDYSIIAEELNLPVDSLNSFVAKKKKSFHRFRPHTIKRHINFETRSRIDENKLDLPGILFEEFPARIYPNKARLTHVLGYLRVITEELSLQKEQENIYKLGDISGYSGVEKFYESLLRGKDGIEYRLVDIYGIDHGIDADNRGIPSIPGNYINLTIDSKLQNFIEEIFEGKQGAVICMNPLSGEVLACLSAPDYDLNSFVGPVPIEIWDKWNKDNGRPLLNRVIQGLYPPGSTLKLIAAALALEQGKIGSEWKVNCRGVYTFGDRSFHCWNTAGHGEIDMHGAILHSCNIYFYQLMKNLSFEDWKKMAEDFGFGSVTGIDLYGEEEGNIPGTEYMNKKYGRYGWAAGNLLTFVIGQGDVLTTPLQIVQMMNLIASRGKTHFPNLYLNHTSKKHQLTLKSSTWDLLQDATWDVVNHNDGTGKLAKVVAADVYGKTGTAQNPHGEDHSWFTGFMRMKNESMISLAVLVEHGGKGSVEAAIISGKIFKYAQQKPLLQ